MDKNFSKTVSIIMPCFNSETFIEESIKSVINQTYADWELLICDDDSDDNSKSIIKSYQNVDTRIRLITNHYSKGAPGARNSCLDMAKGRYIAFLDSDDIWLPEKLNKQLNFMDEKKSSFSFSYYQTMNEEGIIEGVYKSPRVVGIEKMLLSNFIGCLTAIYDSQVLGKFYQPEIKKRNDYALWLIMFRQKRGLKAHCLTEVTSKYRVNSYGLSSNKLSAFKYYRICLRKFASLGEIQINLLCGFYLMILLFKKKFPKIYNYFVSKI